MADSPAPRSLMTAVHRVQLAEYGVYSAAVAWRDAETHGRDAEAADLLLPLRDAVDRLIAANAALVAPAVTA